MSNLRYNFYTDKYWVNFYELIVALGVDQLGGKYAEKVFADFSLNNFINRTQYNWDSDGNHFIPILASATFCHQGATGQPWVMNDYVEELFLELKRRYKEEYTFSTYGKIYGENEWTSQTSGIGFYDQDFIMDKIPLSALTPEEKQEWLKEARKFSTKLLEILNFTYERYSVLLKNYRTEKNNLLNKVEAITRFNDTPQDSGEFSDDSHTTHITSSKNDYDTLMGRIEEIDRKYRNVLKDWTNEFESLFIHEESL